jgi:hypothetical protein
MGWSAGEVGHTDRLHHITYSPRISLAEHSTVHSCIHLPCSPTRASFENKSHKPHHRFTNPPTKPTKPTNSTSHNARSRKVIPPRLRRLPWYVPFPPLFLYLYPVPPPPHQSTIETLIPANFVSAFAGTYTVVVAAKEGAAMDGARRRWQNQHASARNVLSGGVTGGYKA